MSAWVNQRMPKMLSTIPMRAASRRQHEDLGEVLPHDPVAARAERHADRDFPPPSDARATSRFETLTQAMSSTPMPAPSIVYSSP